MNQPNLELVELIQQKLSKEWSSEKFSNLMTEEIFLTFTEHFTSFSVTHQLRFLLSFLSLKRSTFQVLSPHFSQFFEKFGISSSSSPNSPNRRDISEKSGIDAWVKLIMEILSEYSDIQCLKNDLSNPEFQRTISRIKNEVLNVSMNHPTSARSPKSPMSVSPSNKPSSFFTFGDTENMFSGGSFMEEEEEEEDDEDDFINFFEEEKPRTKKQKNRKESDNFNQSDQFSDVFNNNNNSNNNNNNNNDPNPRKSIEKDKLKIKITKKKNISEGISTLHSVFKISRFTPIKNRVKYLESSVISHSHFPLSFSSENNKNNNENSMLDEEDINDGGNKNMNQKSIQDIILAPLLDLDRSLGTTEKKANPDEFLENERSKIDSSNKASHGSFMSQRMKKTEKKSFFISKKKSVFSDPKRMKMKKSTNNIMLGNSRKGPSAKRVDPTGSRVLKTGNTKNMKPGLSQIGKGEPVKSGGSGGKMMKMISISEVAGRVHLPSHIQKKIRAEEKKKKRLELKERRKRKKEYEKQQKQQMKMKMKKKPPPPKKKKKKETKVTAKPNNPGKKPENKKDGGVTNTATKGKPNKTKKTPKKPKKTKPQKPKQKQKQIVAKTKPLPPPLLIPQGGPGLIPPPSVLPAIPFSTIPNTSKQQLNNNRTQNLRPLPQPRKRKRDEMTPSIPPKKSKKPPPKRRKMNQQQAQQQQQMRNLLRLNQRNQQNMILKQLLMSSSFKSMSKEQQQDIIRRRKTQQINHLQRLLLLNQSFPTGSSNQASNININNNNNNRNNNNNNSIRRNNTQKQNLKKREISKPPQPPNFNFNFFSVPSLKPNSNPTSSNNINRMIPPTQPLQALPQSNKPPQPPLFRPQILSGPKMPSLLENAKKKKITIPTLVPNPNVRPNINSISNQEDEKRKKLLLYQKFLQQQRNATPQQIQIQKQQIYIQQARMMNFNNLNNQKKNSIPKPPTQLGNEKKDDNNPFRAK